MSERVGQALSPAKDLMFYRRKLPHWQPDPGPGRLFFLTWRLAGSLPRNLIRHTARNDCRERIRDDDQQTDKAVSGPLWLKSPIIAGLVRDSLLYGEQERSLYTLQAWVIMPNHVHVLMEPKAPLPAITRWLKGSTARLANQILGRTGEPFWQDECFDHYVRSRDELNRIVRYIENNPVAAGLVQNPSDWPWSSARQTGGSACPTSGSSQSARETCGSACSTELLGAGGH